MPSATTPIEREVGRLTGILEQVAESLKETKQVVQELQEDLQGNTLLTSKLTSHIEELDEKLTKVESQIADLVTVKTKMGGGLVVGLFLLGIFSGLSSTFLSAWSALLSFFHIK